MDTPLFDGKLVHSQRIIYTPSPFARASLVHLQEVGTLQARSPHASTRQGLASYLFFMVESGSGTDSRPARRGLRIPRLPPPLPPLHRRRLMDAALGTLLRSEHGGHL